MKRIARQFALCLDNKGTEASLIPGKVYRMVPDARAAKDDLAEVVTVLALLRWDVLGRLRWRGTR